MRGWARAELLVLTLLPGGILAVGCGSRTSPRGTGSGGGAGGSGSFTCPSTAEDVQAAILVPRCATAGCHDLTDRVAGLDFASPQLVERLAGAPALGCFGETVLVPGQPDTSLLYRKVADGKPECGLRMPIDGTMGPEEVACLRQWILGLAVAPGTPDGGVAGATDAAVDAPASANACVGTQTSCNGRCVDVKTDNLNCGVCGRACGGGSSCVAGMCSCPAGQTVCGASCVDVTGNEQNCGACGRSCTTGQLCINNACTCGGSLMLCGTTCADVTSDVANCGRCGMACGAGFVCSNGMCQRGACPRAATNCGGSCVDIQSSALHCGACGKACAAGQTCSGGSCGCGSSEMLCGTTCANIQTDPANCGACGKICPAGSSCSVGMCGCGSNLTPCGPACVDTQADSTNCGSCGKACPSGQSCAAGMCSAGCAGGTSKCGDTCVDLKADNKNCGICAKTCAAAETCTNGTCVGCGAQVSFANQVQPIFTAKCTTGCHGGVRPSAGLELTAGAAYAALVGTTASECGGQRIRVVAGDVAKSYLINKLTGQGMCSGTEMPARGATLPASEIDAIRAWICNGAPKN